MKFIHTADWHLGKLVHGVYMTEEQREVLHQFVELVEQEKPDAVVIAGDLYDRSVPPTEAVELLDKTLFKINVELRTPILAISGNHDSAERLSFGASWYKHSKFYMQGKLSSDLSPIHLGGVNFYLVPYAEPGIVRQVLNDDSIHSHDDAMRAIVGQIEKNLNSKEPNVFIGHAFVLGGQTSDSERILSVGGSGCVSSDCFAPFSYTALGHLHSPDAIKHATIRYSGSLLKYSFSEAKQRKSVSIVTVQDNGSIEIEERTLAPKRDMREIEGYLEELLEPTFMNGNGQEDYLKVTLLDDGAILDPINKLRQVYPNVLHLERKVDRLDMKQKQSLRGLNTEKVTELSLFEQFYQEMTTTPFTKEKKDLMAAIIDKVKGEPRNI
ncbi:exonuclease SbcCD subunit D [Heyndrickxia acidicola]|uniref:Nuclease SbcCD subunit D n=1 Tax=Heyndrickxia acidicola TaxID=209389 RepID=A0ABU6MC68_9BACI|nr:exonuclease SbcCD subunit D [Heyndrickxia acidicola]MED1201884.1 exonuclease SbcCD subunit D [Heyndrickxia acidicola]